MSYDGTVRCRYCYQSGHNKRSCPEFTAVLKRRALEEIQNGEGYDAYWNKQYNKRVRKEGLYADGTAMPAEVKAANKQVRRCKYCNKQGHNTRTCPTLKFDKAAWITAEVEHRVQLMGAARSAGVGVGALLKTERWGDTHAWIVTDIRFDQVTRARTEAGGLLVCKRLGSAGEHRYNGVDSLAYPPMDGISAGAWSKAEVLSPIQSSGVNFPSDFATEEALVELAKEQFTDARSSCWYDNQ